MQIPLIFSGTSISRRSGILAAAGLLTLCGAVFYITAMLRHTGGIPSPPLDDTYIYLQYARRAAEGHLLSYSDGSPASTGASSYLHLLLLIPGWWAGLHGPAFVLFAIGLGAVYLFLTLAAGTSLVGRLVGTRAGASSWGAAAAWLALVSLNGHFVWGAMTGMETALYALALVALADAVARRGPRPGWTWLLAGALPIVRPEGLVLGILALAVLYGAARRQADGGPPAAGRGAAALRRVGFSWGAVLLLLLPALVNWALTGSPQWDGVTVKSLLAENRPDVLAEWLRRLPAIWREILFLHLNDFGSRLWSRPAEWALTAVMGAGLLPGAVILGSGRRGVAGLLLVAWLAAGILIGGLSPVWSAHYFRYDIPYVPLAAAVTVVGWEALAGRLAGRRRGAVFGVTVVSVALLLIPGARTMRELYGRNCANILEQQTRVARWIATTTPAGARVAVNDAGAIAYYGNRRIVDLVGLTTHGFAGPNHNGEGALFEKLESLPAGQRPDYLAVYPRWYPALAATAFAGPVLFSADLADNTICGDRLMTVSRIDWSRAGADELPVERGYLVREFGMSLVDSIDVENLASENTHAYSWRKTFKDRLDQLPAEGEGGVSRNAAGSPAPAGRPTLIDGGRWISEGERFQVHVRPRNWLVLVMRTRVEVPLELDIQVNGKPAGRLTADPRSRSFSEPLLQISDSLVTDSLLTIDVSRVRSPRGDGYASYHYWLLQP